jgi:hypothetical protein
MMNHFSKSDRFLAIVLAAAVLVATSIANGAERIIPLETAHAHNDYEHKRPLFDALDHGFCSVEADIYLVDRKLLVAHDRSKVSPKQTLQALYLDPLRQRIHDNGGRVYREGPPVTLLIDIKSEAEATYAVLREVLKTYSDILTSFSGDSIQTNGLVVILSGNRPRRMLKEESVRYAAFDGRLEDLDGHEPKNFIPLISDNWSRTFRWPGIGPLPESERRRLTEIVGKAHAQGRRLRLWATPDTAAAWEQLANAGVDLINTDDLAGLQAFLLSRRR